MTVDVFCDVKDCLRWAEGCSSTVSAAEARRDAMRVGWTGERDDDFCPDHAGGEGTDGD